MRRYCFVLVVFSILLQVSCVRPVCTKNQWDRFRKVYDEDKVFKNGDINPLKQCPLHKVDLVEMDVYHMPGMPKVPSRSYIMAKLRQFPQSFLYVQTGDCTARSYCTKYHCCKICRAKEIAWLKLHNEYIPDCSIPSDF